MSTLSVDTIQGKTTAGTVAIPNHVIQFVYVEETGTQAYASDAEFDLFNASITPTNVSSKILISINIQYSFSNANGDFGLFLKRGSSRIGGKSNDTSRGGSNIWFANDDRVSDEAQGNYNLLNTSWQYLDSPSSSTSVTYTVGAKVTTVFNLNRHHGNSNGGTSSISLMEIAG